MLAKKSIAKIYYYMLTPKLEAKIYYKFFIWSLRKVKQKSTIMTSWYDCYEKWKDDVDEEHDKGVQVDPGKCVDQAIFGWHHAESGEHVVTVDQGEQCLWSWRQRLKLEVVRGKDQPTAERVASVHESCAYCKPVNVIFNSKVWQSLSFFPNIIR